MLAELTPGDLNRFFFTLGGAEANENAIRIARMVTGRQKIMARYRSYHGATSGAISLTGDPRRWANEPGLPGVVRFFDPYKYRSHLYREGDTDEMFTRHCLDEIEEILAYEGAHTIAAIFIETVTGTNGLIVPPDGYLQGLRAICDRHGILLVADEVQTGMGRTGKMFAMEHWSVVPDIVCLAKGIASGMPLGAIIAKDTIMDWGPGSHASTFGGNPVSCVAALETINLLEESLMETARVVGEHLKSRLTELMNRHKLIGDVRGLGLMIGAELVRDRGTKEPASTERDEIVQLCFRRGLLLLGCGVNTLRFCPPLVVTKEQCDTAIAILDDVLKKWD
jgi:4-aminobutyrate aminotransferase-like enzyme